MPPIMSNNEEALVSFLLKEGKVLAESRKDAKTRPDKTTKELEEIHTKATNSIRKILNHLENVQQPLPLIFKQAIPNVLDKIQATIDQLRGLDHANSYSYKELADQVDALKPPKPGSSSLEVPDQGPADDDGDGIDPPEVPFESLDVKEKQCLFCFCLFRAGEQVKKREPIHLWVALDLVSDPLEGVMVLDKLVKERYIYQEETGGRKRNRYKMKPSVHSMLVNVMNIKSTSKRFINMMEQSQQPPTTPTGVGSSLGTLVLNDGDGSIIQARTLDWISKINNTVKVLYLGSWLHNYSKRDIVMEVEALEGLTSHIEDITLLSLKGISGIEELPNSVYKLEHLKVLDLRGCFDLESLPEGIGSLKQLTHLDLSDCYKLALIPIGVTSLTKLRVLKGFVIHPHDEEEAPSDEENGVIIGCCGSKKVRPKSASFGELKTLTKLLKLTIHNKRVNFPTANDLNTLCAMKTLKNLKVEWKCYYTDDEIDDDILGGRFPASLKKLKLEATPNKTMARLLKMIGSDDQISLKKFYFKGGPWSDGGLQEHISHVQHVRLQWLYYLRICWDDFRNFFPDLTLLETHECPHLRFFPCDNDHPWKK